MTRETEHGGGGLGTVRIETHGCKLNQADSEVLSRQFLQAGYSIAEHSGAADIYIINTCTVTHVADRKARQAIRAVHRDNPSALVVATGCYAQRAGEELDGIPGVGLVVGNTEKHRLVEMVMAARGDPVVPCAVGQDQGTPNFGGGIGRTRAFIKIQEGCNQVCAYCIVPKVRGREISIPQEALVDQVKQRVREGYKEVVLTGTQLGSYGFELAETDLAGLLGSLLAETGIERLRVSSLQPQEITADLLSLWKDSRLCPHFHMPLQSGSDNVLKRMRRRYETEQFGEAVKRVRAEVPGVAITADVIVGFPGESQDQFRETVRTVEKIRFSGIHVFPYSVRPGTSAAYMGPPVEYATKRKRMREMLDLARWQASVFRRASLGTIRRVLWERTEVRDGGRIHLGLTDNYMKVHAEDGSMLLNQITPASLVAESGESILAEVVRPAS